METIKTPEISLPSTEPNGQDEGTVLQNIMLHEEKFTPSATPQQNSEPHPWLEILGKYEGEVWEEFREIMRKNRERDDREAAVE